MKLKVKVVIPGMPVPSYHTTGSVGLDLRVAIADPIQILPGARMLVSTGIAVAIPDGYEGQVRPRSGSALKHGLTVLNSPGTIDPDYRGVLQILLVNLGSEPVDIAPMDRIAQLVICPIVQAEIEQVDELEPTERGSKGYGSTGRT